MMETKIPVVISFTPNYFVPAATLIKSILDSTGNNTQFHVICLLSEELSIDMKNDLIGLNVNQLTFSFVNLTGTLDGVHINERFTVAASYRLLLPDLLKEYKKVLYVDCDMIIRQDLSKLFFSVDLKNNYFAGVLEATLETQIQYLKSIDCEPGKYINSGFLVLNLELLRRDHISSRLLQTSNNSKLIFPDQDAINIVCKGRILAIPPYYNSIRTYFLPQYKSIFLEYYSQKDWMYIQINGNIHYTGEKPWKAYTIQFDKWWDTYLTLPEKFRTKYILQKSEKVFFLYRLYKNTFFRTIFLCFQHLYRFIKK